MESYTSLGPMKIYRLKSINRKLEKIPRSIELFNGSFIENKHFDIISGQSEPLVDLNLAQSMFLERGFTVITKDQLTSWSAIKFQQIVKLREGAMRAARYWEPTAKGSELYFENYGSEQSSLSLLLDLFRYNFLRNYISQISLDEEVTLTNLIVDLDRLARSLMPPEINSSLQIRCMKIIANEAEEEEMNTLQFHKDNGFVYSAVVPLENIGPDILVLDENSNKIILITSESNSISLFTGADAFVQYPNFFKRYSPIGTLGTLHRSPYVHGNRLVMGLFYGNLCRTPWSNLFRDPHGFYLRTSIQKSGRKEKTL